jgi:FkbM family methyltransferase
VLNHHSIVNRLGRKLSSTTTQLLGIDGITGRRVVPRADMQRLGSKYGGWSIPTTMLNAQSICYCVGCGEDISFDLALIEQFGCKAYGFDPTPRAIEHVSKVASGNESYVFSPIGLWNDDTTLKFFQPKDPTHVSHSALNLQKTDGYFEARVQRLSTIMKANNHSVLDLLKLDIEGAEYAVLDDVLQERTPILILCVEFDEYFQPMDATYKKRINDAVDKLCAANFVLIHTEGNGNYTFVNESIAQ